MGHTFFNSYGQVHYYLVIGSGLPDVDNGIAYFKSKFRLCACEAFGGVFKFEIALCLAAVFSAHLCALNSQLDYLFLGLAENLLTLCVGGGVVKMNDSVLCALESLESLCNDMLSCLSKYLNGNIVGDKVVLDQLAAELIFSLACCGEADLDLLEADPYKVLEEFKLFFQRHRNDKSLISVTEVNAAPNGSMVDILLLRPLEALNGGHKIASGILCVVCHCKNSFSKILRQF